MDSKHTDHSQYFRLPTNLTDERCRRRLKEDLELDDEAIEVIMGLRSQVTALQARLRELETMVEVARVESGFRLTRYRQVFLEATWEEIES